MIGSCPLVEAMYSGRLCGKWTAVNFVPTPHSPASLVNSLAGAPVPRTSAYDWFSNAITITWLHVGVTVVRPHGEVAAAAVVPASVHGTSTASGGREHDQQASAGHGHAPEYAGRRRHPRGLSREH